MGLFGRKKKKEEEFYDPNLIEVYEFYFGKKFKGKMTDEELADLIEYIESQQEIQK